VGYGPGLLDILWFFLLFIEIWLLITVFIDIFRRHDMKGWLKAFWVLFVIIFPAHRDPAVPRHLRQ
jgi:hypothetical protein